MFVVCCWWSFYHVFLSHCLFQLRLGYVCCFNYWWSFCHVLSHDFLLHVKDLFISYVVYESIIFS
jgi:hypothetical protein